MVPSRKTFRLKLPSRTLVLGERTLLMGVLNVTPDSFSDGGKFLEPELAVEQAFVMAHAGADLLDVGGESTRPGSRETSAAEELDRILPVLEALRSRLKIPISVDTRRAAVAELALRAGAEIVNDISGLQHDPQIASVAARQGVPLILMHMRGEPRTMQAGPFARDVMKDVPQGLRRSVAVARRAGVAKSQIILDPASASARALRKTTNCCRNSRNSPGLAFHFWWGTSRKGFLGATLARDGIARASGRAHLGHRRNGYREPILNGAHIVRVHDVAEMVQVARVTDCLLDANTKAKKLNAEKLPMGCGFSYSLGYNPHRNTVAPVSHHYSLEKRQTHASPHSYSFVSFAQPFSISPCAASAVATREERPVNSCAKRSRNGRMLNDRGVCMRAGSGENSAHCDGPVAA